MNDNRYNPNTDQNERTRQIPVQRSESQINNAQTRQIPVQRSNGQNTVRTRQIPVQRQNPASAARVTQDTPSTVSPAAATNGETRQIPVQRSAMHGETLRTKAVSSQRPAAQQNASDTKQFPVQRQSTAARPVQRPSVKSTASSAQPNTARTAQVSDAGTKQIPAQKSADRIENAQTRQTPIPKTAKNTAVADELSSTKQVPSIPADASANVEDNIYGSKISDQSSGETSSESKKKSRSFLAEKEDDGDGNTIVNVIKAVVYIVAVLVVSITASIFIILVGNDVYAFVKSDEVVELTIPEDADIDDIASILSDSNVIKYPGIFKWYADHNNDDGKFIAGNYSIASNLDYEDLLASFKEQINEGTSWVTIPEGYTTDEIINLLVETGIGTKEKYVDVINNYPFDYWFVQELDATDWKSTGRFYRLDGYLFPDTYEFYNESSERAVVEKLLARFNTIFGKKYRESTEAMNMTVDEIVTIASMIEKEAGKAADYHLVSSVFHNRLASDYFPKLESDATVLYAIHHDTGERPTDVTGEHMKYDTPYNTYLYEGLPPGPIANPSASSINAALTPENTGYYYFVSDGYNTYFAKNNDEHERNKAMVASLKNQDS